MEFLLLTVSVLFSIVGLISGLFFFLTPKYTIEIQRRFYEKINWRIEPISLQKEIRNTKIMGLLLVVIALLVTSYIFTKAF